MKVFWPNTKGTRLSRSSILVLSKRGDHVVGKIFITRSGYDPQLGKHVKDPYLGPHPTFGACRPDIRKQLKKEDQVFVISGKIPDYNQFVMGGFEIEAKIPAIEAYRLFPDLRLRRLEDGQLTGNIIVTADGRQHEERRVGKEGRSRWSPYH